MDAMTFVLGTLFGFGIGLIFTIREVEDHTKSLKEFLAFLEKLRDTTQSFDKTANEEVKK